MNRGRLAIFGGTFDPPHLGHLAIIDAAHQQLGCDIVVVVAGDPYHKPRVNTPAEQRYTMVDAALKRRPWAHPCRVELERVGPSYTADTIDELRALYPDHELHLIIGADQNLTHWHRANDICAHTTIWVAERAGSQIAAGSNHLRVPQPRLELSSTHIRNLAASGENIDAFVEPAVADIITNTGLYQNSTVTASGH